MMKGDLWVEWRPSPAAMAHEIPFKSLTFPGGEVHVELDDVPPDLPGIIIFHARTTDAAGLLQLALLKNAVDHRIRGGSRWVNRPKMILDMPYLPYARQDRVTSPGTAFSLEWMAGFINSMHFDQVELLDVHSPVALALIDNAVDRRQADLVELVAGIAGYLAGRPYCIVAPDAGAEKRAFEMYYALQERSHDAAGRVALCAKTRKPSTGEVTRMECTAEANEGEVAVVVDDICDGGATFVHVASVLAGAGFNERILVVTHGIFSKGIDGLLAIYNGLFTTDSWQRDTPLGLGGMYSAFLGRGA